MDEAYEWLAKLEQRIADLEALKGAGATGEKERFSEAPVGQRFRLAPSVEVVVNEEGTELQLLNNTGQVGLRLLAGVEGGEVQVLDAAGQPVVRLSSQGSGGHLEISNAAGHVVLRLRATEEGGVIECYLPDRERVVASMESRASSGGCLQIWDAFGECGFRIRGEGQGMRLEFMRLGDVVLACRL